MRTNILKIPKDYFNTRETLERVLRLVADAVTNLLALGRRPLEVSMVRWPFHADLSVAFQVSLSRFLEKYVAGA
jgi:hypothetical protein